MAWNLLFTSDIGLFSLIGLGFIICMAIWFARFFKRKMIEDEQRMRKSGSR